MLVVYLWPSVKLAGLWIAVVETGLGKPIGLAYRLMACSRSIYEVARDMTSEPAELVIEPEEESSEEEPAVSGDARASWANQYELFLSCLGLSMALGNFWRLPIVISANGGAAFLVVYSVTSVLVGKPVYIMEFFLGQFSSQGSVAIWRCVPVGRELRVPFARRDSQEAAPLRRRRHLHVLREPADQPVPGVLDGAHHALHLAVHWRQVALVFLQRRPRAASCPSRALDLNHRLAVLYADANLSEGREISYGGRTFHAPAAYVDNLTDRCQYGTHTAAEEFYLYVLPP
ncbi:hypothetical protein HPB48_006384 [Haemaphysalis longicornis]|uniref:Sodium-dependent nutrient amino acid transporter 1 n=1 Tax=Haemaphysalis longicornis TaxID=44386 RepID=A0A9J6FAG1_HAELO|nr:hypothetical protein HPB48_006384 [Haemaphysalis longicornis]